MPSGIIGLEHIRTNIKEACAIMDSGSTGYLSDAQFIVITRGFGQFPSDVDFTTKILPEISVNGSISFDAFERFILKSMVDHLYDPDDSVTLWNAFRALDEEKKGTIPLSVMYSIGIEASTQFIHGDKFMYEEYIKKACNVLEF